jgi:hypothetical protein
MIRKNISTLFSHHVLVDFSDNIYVADYTEITKTLPIKRSVEIFSPNPPNDNQYLEIENSDSMEITNVVFDNSSFVYSNNNPKSQCETCSFPKTSKIGNWILFTELKYSSKPLNNKNNLKKAIKQLFKTRFHYIQGGVFNQSEILSYLVASLPLQSEPFTNFSLTQSYLQNLKEKHNVILRLTNKVEIIDKNTILVV